MEISRIVVKSEIQCRVSMLFFQDESLTGFIKKHLLQCLLFVLHVQLRVQKLTGYFPYEKPNLSCGGASFN